LRIFISDKVLKGLDVSKFDVRKYSIRLLRKDELVSGKLIEGEFKNFPKVSEFFVEVKKDFWISFKPGKAYGKRYRD